MNYLVERQFFLTYNQGCSEVGGEHSWTLHFCEVSTVYNFSSNKWPHFFPAVMYWRSFCILLKLNTGRILLHNYVAAIRHCAMVALVVLRHKCYPQSSYVCMHCTFCFLQGCVTNYAIELFCFLLQDVLSSIFLQM